jgi:SAM-dependent methyltransferase
MVVDSATMPPMDHPDADPTWRYPWPAGARLAADLPHLGTWTGLRAAELGCGQGRVGRTLLDLGVAHLAFADISPEPLDFLRHALGEDPRVALHQHAWGDPLPGGPYDLLVGGDILYRPAYFDRLVQSLALSLADAGLILLADPRTTLEPELTAALQDAGLTAFQERRPGPYTLLRSEKQRR